MVSFRMDPALLFIFTNVTYDIEPSLVFEFLMRLYSNKYSLHKHCADKPAKIVFKISILIRQDEVSVRINMPIAMVYKMESVSALVNFDKARSNLGFFKFLIKCFDS